MDFAFEDEHWPEEDEDEHWPEEDGDDKPSITIHIGYGNGAVVSLRRALPRKGLFRSIDDSKKAAFSEFFDWLSTNYDNEPWFRFRNKNEELSVCRKGIVFIRFKLDF